MKAVLAILLLSTIVASTPSTAASECQYAGGGQYSSSETGPRNLFIWDDFLKAPRTSPLGASGNLTLTYSTPCKDSYILSLPDAVGSKANSAKGIFQHLIVAEGGQAYGDLVNGPSQPIPFEANTPKALTVAWELRRATATEYESYRAEAQANAQKHGRNSLDEEVIVQMSLKPASTATCEVGTTACATVTTTINFALRYRVPATDLQFSCSAPKAIKLTNANEQTVTGPTCSTNHALQFSVELTGDLRDRLVSFSSLQTGPLLSPGPVNAGPLVLGFDGVKGELILPAGNHTLQFTIIGGGGGGAITFVNSQATFSQVFEQPSNSFLSNAGNPSKPAFWVWALPLLAAGLGVAGKKAHKKGWLTRQEGQEGFFSRLFAKPPETGRRL